MKFKILDSGTDRVVLGLENLSPSHPSMMRLVPNGKPFEEMRVGETQGCAAMGIERKGEAAEPYDVVRTE